MVWEEAKWSSTPSRRTPWVCKVKMPLPFRRSVEASCFLQVACSLEQLSGSFGRCHLLI